MKVRGLVQNRNLSGQSLVELILAIALFTITISGLVMFIINSYDLNRRVHESAQALAYTEEGLDALRAIRDQAWNQLQYSTSGLEQNLAGAWQLMGEGTSDTPETGYQRKIAIEGVHRDDQGEIVETGGVLDPNTKKITSRVTWNIGGHSGQIEAPTYFTNWQSATWQQTDWSGGAGQTIWSDQTRYQTDNGNLEVHLIPGQVTLSATTQTADSHWDFSVPADYNLSDGQKIEVAEGVARLVNIGGSPDQYTMGLWHLDEASGSFLDASIIHFPYHNNLTQISDHPTYSQTGKFDSAVLFDNNDSGSINNGSQKGLGITGQITIDAWIYKTAKATSLEVIASKWKNDGNHRSYALLINGFNHLEFRLSSDGSATGMIIGVAIPQLPLNQWVHVAGVYDGTFIYLFQNGNLVFIFPYNQGIADRSAFFSIASADGMGAKEPNFNGLIDEVRVSNTARWTWYFTPPQSPYSTQFYATDRPNVWPKNSLTVDNLLAWNGFMETATKNGGQIYYQLSADDGATWQYWNGSAWTNVSGESDFNTAEIINTNINSFPSITKRISFKAFLESDGSQQIILDDIKVSYQTGSNFALLGSLESSAFNTGQTSNFQVLNWQESIPVCSPACTIKVQLRAAPDAAGSPGTWTGWSGATGPGSYFTDSAGSMIPTELNGYQWIQYRAELNGDGNNTPILYDLAINYR